MYNKFYEFVFHVDILLEREDLLEVFFMVATQQKPYCVLRLLSIITIQNDFYTTVKKDIQSSWNVHRKITKQQRTKQIGPIFSNFQFAF